MAACKSVRGKEREREKEIKKAIARVRAIERERESGGFAQGLLITETRVPRNTPPPSPGGVDDGPHEVENW